MSNVCAAVAAVLFFVSICYNLVFLAASMSDLLFCMQEGGIFPLRRTVTRKPGSGHHYLENTATFFRPIENACAKLLPQNISPQIKRSSKTVFQNKNLELHQDSC